MQTFRCAIAALTLLIAMAFTLSSQETSAQENACSDPLLIAFSADAQYDAACEAFMACFERTGDHVPCTLYFLDTRLMACPDGDLLCAARARLHTALIGLTVGNGYQHHGQADDFWHAMAGRIAEIDFGELTNAEEATDWYTPLIEAYQLHPMISYSLGVLKQTLGDFDGAISAFGSALSLSTDEPLIYLTLADLHAVLGDEALAAINYYMVAATAEDAGLPENIAAYIGGLDERFQLDISAAEDYALFPVLQRYAGPGGTSVYDRSLNEPQPVRLLKTSNRLLLIPEEAETELEKNQYRVNLPLYVFNSDGNGAYTWRGEDYDDGYLSQMVLIEADGALEGYRSDIVFEGSSMLVLTLAPFGQADPRLDPFRCESAPASLLSIGMSAVRLNVFTEPFALYDEPDGDIVSEFTQGQEVVLLVTDGPVCDGPFTWYEVSLEDSDETGWVRENLDETRYAIAPATGD